MSYLIVRVHETLSAALPLTPDLRTTLLTQRQHLQSSLFGGVHLTRLRVTTRPGPTVPGMQVEPTLPEAFTPQPGFSTAYLTQETLRLHAQNDSESLGHSDPVDLDTLLRAWQA